MYASISGFGQEGPYRDRPGYDQIVQGMSGLMWLTGTAESAPLRVGIPIGDLLAGYFAALGILTALLEREVSGRGQKVETSLLEALTGSLSFQAAKYVNTGEVPPPVGNHHPLTAPMGVYRAQDEVLQPGRRQRLHVAALLQGDRAARPGRRRALRRQLARVKHRQALDAVLETALAPRRSAAEWVEVLNAAGSGLRPHQHGGSGLRRPADPPGRPCAAPRPRWRCPAPGRPGGSAGRRRPDPPR